VVPLYILVAANLVNMHSGFNGLASGTSLIILIFLILKSFIVGFSGDIVAIGALTGSLIALWWYNRYPSQIFEGNTGALMIGAAIGIVIIVKGFYITGFIMFIPHTFNFFLYMFWRIKRLQDPNDSRYTTVKWGSMRRDGTLKVPNMLTLKWILPYRYKMTEKQSVLAMYLLTIIFCSIALILPINEGFF